jgi:FkbM family methyltransferase
MTDRNRDMPTTVTLPGLRHAIRVADRQPTFWARVGQGTWEPDLVRLLAARLHPGSTFLDLGAWVGPTAMIAANLGARVIAIEADPAALDQFAANIAANPDLAQRIALLPVAVASRRGPLAMGSRRKPGDSMSSALLAGAPTGWTTQALTPADLALLCADATSLLVKLDIEGGEYDLLPAMAPLLQEQEGRSGPDLVVSFHQRELTAAVGPQEAAQATTAALASLDGWRGEPVDATWTPDGRPAVPAQEIGRRLIDDAACPDTWLFRRS